MTRPRNRRRVVGEAVRVFAGEVDDPRSRRPTDALSLLAWSVCVALLGAAARPQPGIERRLIQFLRALPSGFDGLWRVSAGAILVFVFVVAVAAVVGSRWAVLRDALCAAAVVLAVGAVAVRVLHGDWPSWPDTLGYRTGQPVSVPIGLTVAAAVSVTMSPHLSRPLRRLGRFLIAAGAVGTVLLGAATPIDVAVGVFLALAGAAAVRLVFGSGNGRPRIEDVVRALQSLDVEVTEIRAARLQAAGVFVLDATDTAGRPLTVKIYGRDAHDTQLLTTAWRTIWYREAGAPSWFGRREQAEHEAFVTLLARQAGAVTSRVVTAGGTVTGDVALVLADGGVPIPAGEWNPSLTVESWAALGTLHDANIAHGCVEIDNLRRIGDDVGLVDLRGAEVAPAEDRLHTDRAQLLIATSLVADVESAVEAAVDSLGAEQLASALPFLQPAILTPAQRRSVRAAKLDLDGLRAYAAKRIAVDAPQLQQLRRVTLRSVLQLALLVAAFFAMAAAFGGLDLSGLFDQLEHATWWLVIAAVLVAQASRLTAAWSVLSAAPVKLPLGPVYALQLANSYISLAVPTTAARVAVNIRFLQRRGLQAGTAMAVGLVDSITEFLVQIAITGALLVLTSASLHLDLGDSTPAALNALVVVTVALAAAAIAVVFLVPSWRRFVVGWIVRLAREATYVVGTLRSPPRLAALLSANVGTELVLAISMATIVRAFHYDIGLAEVLFITVSVRVITGLLPIPGGVGVAESGLVFGLVRAGLPEEVAFAAVLIYRLATFYLPPVWGFFALRWLERKTYL